MFLILMYEFYDPMLSEDPPAKLLGNSMVLNCCASHLMLHSLHHIASIGAGGYRKSHRRLDRLDAQVMRLPRLLRASPLPSEAFITPTGLIPWAIWRRRAILGEVAKSKEGHV